MKISNMYQAKTHLSSLVESALNGEEVVIARAGKLLVKLIPYTEDMQSRKPGLLKGKITIPADFDTDSQNIFDLFHNNDDVL